MTYEYIKWSVSIIFVGINLEFDGHETRALYWSLSQVAKRLPVHVITLLTSTSVDTKDEYHAGRSWFLVDVTYRHVTSDQDVTE